MVDAKTIDNLGIDTSVRWAQDQEFLDKSLIKESPFISRQTTIDVTNPSFASEFDTLFQINKRFAPWALLLSPSGYNLQKMRLFTYQSIPSLGSDEFLSTQMEKIKDKVTASKKARQKRREEGQGSEYPWEDEREEGDEMRESKTLIALLEYLQLIDSMMIEINSRRSQYQKG
ncbi:MAG: DUF5399 family protein [Candidatus Neptunochlamydia sp.]|nr:DUF5399 family protein [Candidatus Neptunochlamydia sp.]